MAVLPIQLARVSSLQRSNVALQSMTRTEQSLLDVQNQLSTGKKLNVPSDDPSSAAVAQQLHKLLEQRQAYANNLQSANSNLSEVDSTLGDLSDLLKQSQSIASANVGSDVTPDARAGAAAVVQGLYSQLLSIGNKEFNGVYLFGGDRSTAPPFVETDAGVKFVGSDRVLQNQFDENTKLSFMVDGNQVFGALSTRVEGGADLTPTMSDATRLADLGGTTGQGIHLGSIAIGNGATTKVVDLAKCDSVGDVVNTINAAGVGNITASVASDGQSLELNSAGADNIAVNEVGGGTTAADLGILTPTGGGAGLAVQGQKLSPMVTALTKLADLRGGLGIDTKGLTITNGQTTKTVDLSGVTDVQGLLNAVNNSGTGVLASINAAGTGIDIVNPVQGASMTIAEAGGTTAADLGVRSFDATSPLSQLNGGAGVRTAAGPDMQITRADGTTFNVDVSNLHTVQDVINAINTADGGAGVTASFSAAGSGLELTDTTGGPGQLKVTPLNSSNAVTDLGLDTSASGNVLTGRNVNSVKAEGIFAHIAQLRDSLEKNDQQGITAAAQGIQDDLSRVVLVRGQAGARVQELQARQQSLDDQNVATKSLLSNLEDTDFATAVTKFQTLQQALEANMKTTATVLNLSLLDFIS